MKCLKNLRVIVGAFVLMLFTGSTNGMMSGAGKYGACCKPQSAGTVLKAQQGQRLPKLENPEHLGYGQQPQVSAAPEQVKKVGVIKKFFVRWQAKRVAKAAAKKKAAGKKNKNKRAKK